MFCTGGGRVEDTATTLVMNIKDFKLCRFQIDPIIKKSKNGGLPVDVTIDARGDGVFAVCGEGAVEDRGGMIVLGYELCRGVGRDCIVPQRRVP